MPALTTVYAEDNTLHDASTGSTWTDVLTIAGASLASNTKYLVLASGLLGGNSTGSLFGMRVQSDDDANLATLSEAVIEPAISDSTKLHRYWFCEIYETDASPADINIQYSRISGSGNTRAAMTTLLLIELSQLGTEGTHYFVDRLAPNSGEAIPSTLTTAVELDSADTGTDEFVCFSYARVNVSSATSSYVVEFQGADDDNTQHAVITNNEEGEDTAEFRTQGGIWRHKSSGGTVAPRVQWSSSSGNHDNGGAFIIAIPSERFEDFAEEKGAGPIAVSGSTETTVETISVTPTTDGDHIVFAQGAGEGGSRMFFHLEDGTTEIRTGQSTYQQTQNWNAGDAAEAIHFQRVDITGATTLNGRAAFGSGGPFDVTDTNIVVISLEKGTDPPAAAGADIQALAGPGVVLLSG